MECGQRRHGQGGPGPDFLAESSSSGCGVPGGGISASFFCFMIKNTLIPSPTCSSPSQPWFGHRPPLPRSSPRVGHTVHLLAGPRPAGLHFLSRSLLPVLPQLLLNLPLHHLHCFPTHKHMVTSIPANLHNRIRCCGHCPNRWQRTLPLHLRLACARTTRTPITTTLAHHYGYHPFWYHIHQNR